MNFQNIFKPIKKLQWKLTLSYSSVTVGSLIVVVLILSYMLFSYVLVPNQILETALSPAAWISVVSQTTSLKWQYILSQDPIDPELISLILKDGDLQISHFDILHIGDLQVRLRTLAKGSVLIVDPNGILLGASDSTLITELDVGHPLDLNLLPGLEGVVKSAMSGSLDPAQLFVTLKPFEEFYFAIPYFDEKGEDLLAISILYFRDLPTESDLPANIAASIGKSILILLLAAGVVGTIFGGITARGMVKRLRRVSVVTEAWSKGDFSEFIDDPLGDEISQLARKLNYMADQLQDLLERRQEMAVSEERNRLARELHDSAKQDALAASFQIGTALTLYENAPQKAKKHLHEAEVLIDSVRIELTDLIHQLRPATVDGRRFSEVINDYLIEWAHQNNVIVSLETEGELEISLEYKQAIYRIMQEALANAARHSHAKNVSATLDYGINYIEFVVHDDGRGFDPAQSQTGFGLRSMRERAESLGGRFWIESNGGEGTTLHVNFPLNGAKEEYV